MPDSVKAVTQALDLRVCLEQAKAIGQLKEVNGADPKFEVDCYRELGVLK